MHLCEYDLLMKKANKLLDDINKLIEDTYIEENKINKLIEDNNQDSEIINNAHAFINIRM